MLLCLSFLNGKLKTTSSALKSLWFKATLLKCVTLCYSKTLCPGITFCCDAGDYEVGVQCTFLNLPQKKDYALKTQKPTLPPSSHKKIPNKKLQKFF